MALPTRLFRFITHFLWQQKWLFLAAQLFSLGWTLDSTAWPYALKCLIDAFTNFQGDRQHVWSQLAPLLFVWATLWISVSILFRLQGFSLARLFPKLEASVRMSMFEYVLGHSYDYFANHFAGNLSNRISDMTQSITRLLQLVITVFVPAMVALLIVCGMFLRVHPLFSLVLISWSALHLGICAWGAKRCAAYSETHSDSRSLLTGKIVDALSNIINIKLFSRKAYEMNYISSAQADERNKQQKAMVVVEKLKVILDVSSFIFPGVILTYLIIHSWQRHIINTGDVVMIFNATWNITLFMWIVGLELPNFYRELGVCQQAMSLIRTPHAIVDAPAAKPLVVTRGKIVFDQVNFHYYPAQPIFTDLSLTIAPGSKVGLVGFSGSGKTSFVNLLMRFYDIQSGHILIDDQDSQKVSLLSLRRAISMVPQSPTLFHRSLRENIAYGNPDAEDAAIRFAAQQAYCAEFIECLPDGYEALVGERGIKLSGGQRQRIAIARAMLNNAPILVLDEATSALDSVTEKYIHSALRALMKNKTTVVIAHRLSTLAEMDRILVFDKGKIIEDGTHQTLLAQQGHYAMMWNMQANGFLPEDENSLKQNVKHSSQSIIDESEIYL